MTEIKIIDGYEALIIHPNKNNEEYTIMHRGQGGAIISNKNKASAIDEWKKGMQIAKAINKFLLFKKNRVW